MTSLRKFDENPQGQLLDEIRNSRCVMLGSPNPDHHMQPMAPQVDQDTNIIYFYSDNSSELGKAVIKTPAQVHMCHIEDDYQACVRGMLYPHYDKNTIDEYWSTIVSSWYPEGKTDPKMLMLKFIPNSAHVWASDKSTIGFLYETAKANMTSTTPDVGKSKEVKI